MTLVGADRALLDERLDVPYSIAAQPPLYKPAPVPALARITNRAASPSHVEGLGRGTPLLDTFAFTGPVSGHRAATTRMKQSVDADGVVDQWFVSADLDLPDGRVHIEVSRLDRSQMRARIERSLPTMLHGHNQSPVPLAEALVLIARLFEQAAQVVDWLVPVSGLSVQRADLPRDFEQVEHLDRLLSGLARLRVPRCGHVQHRLGGGVVQTLVREIPGAWRAQMYDKHEQLRHLAMTTRDPDLSAVLHSVADTAVGQVRFEAQLRREALRRHGVSTMADLNEDTLLAIREHYFRRCRYDTPVGGAPHLDAVMTTLARTGDPNYKYWGSVLAMLKAEALGLPQPATGSASLAKYRRLAKEWNVSAADLDGLAGPAVALDFASGALRAA